MLNIGKECISEICKKYLEINPSMKKYTFLSLEIIMEVLSFIIILIIIKLFIEKIFRIIGL